MTTLDQEDLELENENEIETENDEDEDDYTEGEEDTRSELEILRQENERLRKQKEKLLLKKKKAIEKKKSPTSTSFDDEYLESRYQKRQTRERFESQNPGLDYDVVEAIAQKKAISMDQATMYIKSGGSFRIGQDAIPNPKDEEKERQERLKSMLGLK